MLKQFVLVFIFSLVCRTFGLETNYSPVLVFKNKQNTNSYPNVVISSTTPMDQETFEKHIAELNPHQKLVFLVTDDLSPEDLSIKNEHNRRGFENLASGVDIIEYIPYVENAVENELTLGIARTSLTLQNELESKNHSEEARIVVVTLPKCDEVECESETRYHAIARIDRACYALSNSKEFTDAIFILTSEMNSHLNDVHKVHSRRARDTTGQTAPSSANVYKNPSSLVYFKNLMQRSRKGTKEEVLAVTGVTTNRIDNKNIEITFASKYPIVLHFTLDDTQYWTLTPSSSKMNSKPIDLQMQMSSPEEFSFACAASVYFKFDKDNAELDGIYFQDLQIQLNFNNTGAANIEKFSDSNDCIGFTSPAIWAGLFITFLLLAIISTAITYIMDIRTMDRFDDPKGKTITINANE